MSDHTNCNQHKAAMAYLKMNLAKVNNESINSFSPIGRSLMNMDATTVWSKLLQFRSWLASRPLDLSFFVTACHNDRQALNNYIEPWAYLPYRCGHSGSSLWSPRFSDKNNGKMGECSVPAICADSSGAACSSGSYSWWRVLDIV